MGQTLPNGIYLPAEGERNCYDGLEGNWRSLDGLISTVAGKASTSHTHGNITNDGKVGTTANLPLITGTGGVVQAGSFGNQANTFCEGNDSRLSDARTPVAHTHTKADVTDLLNSNFIPSANNSYDLGSSSYQWNNLYAKNYYYNGVAWGLDKANTWTGTNTFSLSSLYQKGFSSRASAPASNEFGQFNIVDTNNNPVMSINYANRSTGSRDISLRVYDNAGNANGVGVFKDVSNNYSFCSINPSNTISLGTSDNKWTTLNGINPGALSLPDVSRVTNIDTTGWIFDGSTLNQIKINNAVQALNGWLYIRIANVSNTDSIGVRYISNDKANITFTAPYVPSATHITLSCPIVAGISANVWLSKAPEYIKFYLSLGEVNNFPS